MQKKTKYLYYDTDQRIFNNIVIHKTDHRGTIHSIFLVYTHIQN